MNNQNNIKYLEKPVMLLIVVNIFAVIIESVDSIYNKHVFWFNLIEYSSLFLFSCEYLLRIYFAGKETKEKIKHRLHYIFSLSGAIDFVAIVPGILTLGTVDLRFLRILRLFRLFRILKLGRYSKSFQRFSRVLTEKTPDLTNAIFIVCILLIFASTAIYLFEKEAQPENFSSIPASMWWAIATLTTVGYGDIYPITVGGKLFGSVIALLGVGLVALPASILASGFLEVGEDEKTYCNQCGKQVEDRAA
jgi:voltage-gated potassium channel